ncbi:MAG: hypothetical protein R2690_18825 [Acidimicrobiales bacterium]
MDELLTDRLGIAIRRALAGAGANTVDELEDHFLEPDAPSGRSPRDAHGALTTAAHPPRYRWSVR